MRPRHGWWWDPALACAVLLAQSAPFLFSDRPATDAGGPWTLAEYLPAFGSALPVAFRRQAPLVCLLVSQLSIGAYAVIGTGPPQPVWYGGLVGLYTVAAYARLSHRVTALAVTAAGISVAVGSLSTGMREYLTWSAAFCLGALARSRAELATVTAARQAQLAAERERTGIARDLHDILGHALSVMVVQAEAGGALAHRDPARARAGFDAISDTGRDAMTQLRATVGALRDEVAGAPTPTLAHLPVLVDRARGAGLRVTCTVTGEPRELTPEAQLAGYRAVQEAITNVVRHADATTVKIILDWSRPTRLRITDNGGNAGTGRDHDAAPGAAGTPGGPTQGIGAGGHGLTGIRERVTACGGTLHAGPVDGGFAMEVAFP